MVVSSGKNVKYMILGAILVFHVKKIEPYPFLFFVGKRLCGYSIKSLAEYFHRDPVAMSRGIEKVEGRIKSDRDLEAKLRKLEEVITLGRKRKIRN